MSKEHDTFMDAIESVVGECKPSKEQVRVTSVAEKFYKKLRDGKVSMMVTKTMVMYIHSVLPELSLRQAADLNNTVHTLIKTVLSYLVEDGLIKED